MDKSLFLSLHVHVTRGYNGSYRSVLPAGSVFSFSIVEISGLVKYRYLRMICFGDFFRREGSRYYAKG